jgi:aminopeptidase N
VTSNLTRDEAMTRSALIQVTSYEVEVDLMNGEAEFGSVSVIRFGCGAPGSSTFVNLTAPAVLEITLNSEQVSLDAFDGDRIMLDDLAADNVLRVVAECAYSRSGEGLHRFTDPADGRVYLYSDLETFNAHRVYACFDQPDMKASYELTVTAPADWLVVSNMAPESTSQAGEGLRWHFPPTPVLPTYITAIAAGPYHVVRDEHDGIPLGVFCRQSLAEHLDADEILEITRQGFDFFHGLFGINYPFGKYDQLFVPEFKEGAMENAGCVTFVEAYIFRSRVTDFAREARGETILHEMAHMWFGNLVTMRWWDDLWLNESFATWAGTLAEAEATRWTSAWTTFAQLYKAWAYRQDQLPSTHPIAADIGDIEAVEVNFDGITYAKGAAVLKQLVAYVGRDNFLDGVRKYFAGHAFGNATLADLLSALAETSGRDLAAWSAEWLQTAGVNTLRPSYSVDADGRFTEFTVEQEAAATHPVLRSHRVAIGLYDRTPAGLTRRARIETDVTGPATVIAELTGHRRPDLVLVNDDDLTYAKIRLDEHSLCTLLGSPESGPRESGPRESGNGPQDGRAVGISAFTDSLPAVLCWSAAWDMARDGEMAARDYVRLVMSGISSVADISVVQTLLRQAGQAVRRFADPGWRATGLALMAGTLRELLQSAPAGSDIQLAYTRAFAGVATSGPDLALLAGLLDGSVLLPGLSIDTDLRWSLLGRLVSRSNTASGPQAGGVRVFGGRDIDAELSRDATDAGERHAAACRAAIPTAQAKQQAWETLTGGKQTLATFRATLAGFADPDQPELMEPYLPKYFAVIGNVWRDWSSAMAQDFVEGAYTTGAITPATVEATDAYIAAEQPPTTLRRLLSEGRDEVLRALRAQARDRQAGQAGVGGR